MAFENAPPIAERERMAAEYDGNPEHVSKEEVRQLIINGYVVFRDGKLVAAKEALAVADPEGSA